jgi:hypothetical protein
VPHGGEPAPLAAPDRAPDVRIGLVRDAALARVLDEVSPARIRATDSALVSFGTRHAMSDTTSAKRGVGVARRWIFATLSDYSRQCGGCLRVEYDPATVVVERRPSKTVISVVNVLAWLPGRDTSRVVVIGATDTLGAVKNDLWAAVRAVGANGHRSLASVIPPLESATR